MAQTLTAQPSSTSAGGRAQEVVLRTVNLTKQYGQRIAVNNLNLEVHRSDIFGFLGPNGAGKTTTIRMVLALIAPTSGHAEILGQSVSANGARILPRVGALVETPALYLYMSGRDNLRAVAAVLGGVPERRIDAVLDQVGLRARAKDRVKTYSLGMKQRLGVALALLHDPEILILDEPANGLDPAGIVEMRDLMHRLSGEGKTVFISSHILSEVQQICTRVAIVSLGQLVREATVEELTRGTGEFAVTVEQPAAALAAIQTQSWGRSARLSERGVVIAPAPGGRGRDLTLFLVQSGFVPDALTPHAQDLEQVFLQLTHSTEGGVQ